MSTSFDGFPVRPRRGGILWVLIIARISTVHQDPRSLADQIALCEKYVRDRYPGPIQFVHIPGQGSGEFLDRRELAEAEAGVEASQFDLVVVEDLGRVCRRNRAVDFCELCEDAGTRLIAINDTIDTAREDWRLNAFFASFKHESANKDTSKRIRRSLRNRFEQGGVNQTFPYGYVKPPGTKSDADVRRDPAAERVYARWFDILEAGGTYTEVADWLNAEGVPTGEWATNEKWDGRMVARVTHNPILKGWRRRNEKKSQRVNKSGRRRSVPALPDERLYRVVPHLAFVPPDRYDRLIADLAVRHAARARGRRAGTPDTRAGVPKKRTVWPGQHVVCGVCGRLMCWGGHGQPSRLMCAGARDYACWNAASFDGPDAGRRLAAAVLAEVERLPAFDDAFLNKVQIEAAARRAGGTEALPRIDRELAQLDRELAHLVDAVSQLGLSPAVQDRLREAEGRKARLTADRADLLARPDDVLPLPPVEELKAKARAAVGALAFDDPAFGRTVHQLAPRIVALPYRPLDGGRVVLRATVTVNLVPLLGRAGEAVGGLIARQVTVDLFDPPQRVALLGAVVAGRAGGATEAATAAQLGLTVTAAQRASALRRLMQAAEATDPYTLLTAPPEGDAKRHWQRHRHPRYRFRPLAGYPAWPSARPRRRPSNRTPSHPAREPCGVFVCHPRRIRHVGRPAYAP